MGMGKRIAAGMAGIAMAVALAACGASSYEQVLLDEADGIKVTAQNAGSDQTATTEGAITVGENDLVVISPCLDKGSFHLTISPTDGGKDLYDEDVDGRILFPIDAEPGTYDVTTSGNGATGWMTVFSQDKDEEAEIAASLDEKLEEVGEEAKDAVREAQGKPAEKPSDEG